MQLESQLDELLSDDELLEELLHVFAVDGVITEATVNALILSLQLCVGLTDVFNLHGFLLVPT